MYNKDVETNVNSLIQMLLIDIKQFLHVLVFYLSYTWMERFQLLYKI